MSRKKILLPNRYGVKNYLVPCQENDNKYFLEINDPVDALNVTLAPMEVHMDNYIEAIDPSGGPVIIVGDAFDYGDGQHFVAAIISGHDGYYVYLADTEEDAKRIFADVVESGMTKTGGGDILGFSVESLSSDEAGKKEEMTVPGKKIFIGMIGKAGSGKDTVADYIVERFGFKKMAFADPLKKAVQTIFDVDDDYMFDREKRELPLPGWEPWTVRKLLQFVGTDLMREQVDENIWVKNAVSRIRREELVIISDVRFPNELHGVRDLIGDEYKTIFIKVNRPGHQDAKGGMKNHASESHIDSLEADIDILNDGTLEELYSKVDGIIEEITGG